MENKLFGTPDFFIAFGSPIDANIMDIFGFGRGSPHWPNFCYISKFAGDVALWKIISRDLVGRFGREYAC
jgi:hypothetical protein